jgi:hypothetical protein
MILLFGLPYIDQHNGGCLILIDSGHFEDDIIYLEDISVSINNDHFVLLFKLFLYFNIVLIEDFG